MAIDNPTPEEWRFVVGHEIFYRVSSLGRVYSVFIDGIMKPKINRYGYPTISLHFGKGKQKPVPVHTIVCIAFHGPKPTLVHQVNHKDGVKTNNAAINLEWVTPQENILHAWNTGLMPDISKFHGNNGSGSANLNAKLTDAQVFEIRNMPANVTNAAIGRMYGVHETTAFRARIGESYKHRHS